MHKQWLPAAAIAARLMLICLGAIVIATVTGFAAIEIGNPTPPATCGKGRVSRDRNIVVKPDSPADAIVLDANTGWIVSNERSTCDPLTVCWESANGAVEVFVSLSDVDLCSARPSGPHLDRPGVVLVFVHRRLPFAACMTGPGRLLDPDLLPRCLGYDFNCDGDVDLKDWSERLP